MIIRVFCSFIPINLILEFLVIIPVSLELFLNLFDYNKQPVAAGGAADLNKPLVHLMENGSSESNSGEAPNSDQGTSKSGIDAERALIESQPPITPEDQAWLDANPTYGKDAIESNKMLMAEIEMKKVSLDDNVKGSNSGANNKNERDNKRSK